MIETLTVKLDLRCLVPREDFIWTLDAAYVENTSNPNTDYRADFEVIRKDYYDGWTFPTVTLAPLSGLFYDDLPSCAVELPIDFSDKVFVFDSDGVQTEFDPPNDNSQSQAFYILDDYPAGYKIHYHSMLDFPNLLA